MFTLPSIWNLIVSTIVFFIAAWYLHRYMDDHEIPKGMTRGLSVFVLASLLSWGAGEVVNWLQGPQISNDPVRLLKLPEQKNEEQ